MEVGDSPHIEIAEHAGTCFGVDNAIKIAFEGARRPGNTYILGELVHNPVVVKELSELGVLPIKDISRLKAGDNLIIRAHGEPDEVYEHCKRNNIGIIDCTCPFVRRVQIMAEQLDKSGYSVVIVGDKDHPEVRGIASKAKRATVITEKSDIESELSSKPMLGIISQTTQSLGRFKEIVDHLSSPDKKLEIHNTICNATKNRQEAALRLCDNVDTMVIIGGKNSANTRRLFELCSEKVNTIWVTGPEDLDKSKLRGRIGITAGASTPKQTISEVKQAIAKKDF